jgi:pimeloyl-ACP methyl ester carboxylesterase
MARKDHCKIFVGAGVTLGLMSVPALIRHMDRRRESRERTEDRPSILDGEEKGGVHSLDGTALYVDYLGEKDPTVFFVHGFTNCTQEFYYQKPYFAEKYRVVGLDLRGHGRSEIPVSRDYHAERFAEDLKAVVDAFEPERFVVAGHSLGGLATFKFYELFGKKYEGRLKGLAIIDSTGIDISSKFGSGFTLKWTLLMKYCSILMDNNLYKMIFEKLSDSPLYYLLVRWLLSSKRRSASALEFFQQVGCLTPIATLKGIANVANEGWQQEHSLPNVNIPVMLLVGSEDDITKTDRENRRTYSLLPDARLKVLEGAGHLALQEMPEEFNETLDGFLAEVFGKG